MTMFGIQTLVVKSPSSDSLMWEYDIDGIKKVRIECERGVRSVLCEENSRGALLEIRGSELKPEKNRKYRLFGINSNMEDFFKGKEEFRFVTDEHTFRWGQDTFRAKLIIIGEIVFHTVPYMSVINEYACSVTPDTPLLKRTVKENFKALAGKIIYEQLLDSDRIIEYPITGLEKKRFVNQGNTIKGDWTVTGFDVIGNEFDKVCAMHRAEENARREISANKRAASIVDSEADILESTRRAVSIAKEIENIKNQE